jgi:exodeoxyribonuclease V alpha subunit
VTPDLETLHAAGILSALDVRLARTLGRIGNEPRAEVLLAIALLSRHVTAGNVCLDLADTVALAAAGVTPTAGWRALLADSPLVAPDAATAAPLVLEDTRLYLHRYWHHECTLAERLRVRAAAVVTPLDLPRFRAGLDRLLPHVGTDPEPNWQRVAAFVALSRRLCVIAGGPGTGKTTTVVSIAALAVEHALARAARPPRIALAAPTGKAAARLTETVRAAKGHLDCAPAVRAAVPDEASTIHRLLGASSRRPGRFLRDARSPLHTDLLIVDEASMVDLALMTRLVAALPPAAGLILLGDRDQLASVEAGAVLGDLCGAGGAGYSAAAAAAVTAATGESVPERAGAGAIADSIVTLTRSRRYGTESDIGLLAAAIRRGADDDVLALLASDAHPLVARVDPPRPDTRSPALRDAIVAGYAPALQADDPAARLARLGAFRILCAHRHGPDGVVAMNDEAERVLGAAGLLVVDGPFYVGRPIMVTRNDYRLGVFNGDVGTVVAGEADEPERLAFFQSASGTGRWLSPGRLPPCETAFASSIHKSQGSEIERVLVMLPARSSPVLSRELLYTAVSRARQQVTICAGPDVLRETIRTPVRRASGLRVRLWGPEPS